MNSILLVLCIGSALTVSIKGERIPFKEVKFNVLRSAEPFNSILEPLNNAEIILCQILHDVNNSSALIPYAIRVTNAIRNAIQNNKNEFNANLQQIVLDSTDIYEMDLDLNRFISWMDDVDTTIDIIEANDDPVIVFVDFRYLEKKIREEASFFDNDRSRQKYATIWMNPLLSLYAYALAYEGIIKEKKSDIRTDFQVSCIVKNVLLKYRNLCVEHRLKTVQVAENSITANTFLRYILSYTSVQTQRDLLADIVINLPYNESGYMEYETSIDCEKTVSVPGAIFSKKHKFIDENLDSNNVTYYLHRDDDDQFWICLKEYMKFGRYKIERFFDGPIRLMNRLCSMKRHKPDEVPTGYGFLTIRINKLYLVSFDNGTSCSTDNSKCKVYIKVLIDDSELMRTTSIEMDMKNYYDSIPYASTRSQKVQKNSSKIIFEIWSEHGNQPHHKLEKNIIEVLLSSRKLITNEFNRFEYEAYWEDEYPPKIQNS